MRVLLDTHVFLWAVADSRKLRADARSRIRAAEAVFVSAASIWEIAIKAKLGKLDADPEQLAGAIEGSGFTELPVRAVHAARLSRLASHHQDPFDRLLVAQAMTEPLILLTADRNLSAYGEWVQQV
jgi:PIN domain nuclease of toxin-antitoxin system